MIPLLMIGLPSIVLVAAYAAVVRALNIAADALFTDWEGEE